MAKKKFEWVNTLDKTLKAIDLGMDSDYYIQEYVSQYRKYEKWLTKQTHGKASMAYPNDPTSRKFILDIKSYESGGPIDRAKFKMALEGKARGYWEKVQAGEMKKMPTANEIIHKLVQGQAFKISRAQGYAQFLHDIELGLYGDDVKITYNPVNDNYDVTGASYNIFRYQSNYRSDELTKFYNDMKEQKKKLFENWSSYKGSMSFEEFLNNYINQLNNEDSKYAKFLFKKISNRNLDDEAIHDIEWSTYDLGEQFGEEYYTHGSP